MTTPLAAPSGPSVPPQQAAEMPTDSGTRWHLIVGVIGLVYGIIGLGLYLIGGLWIAFMPQLMGMMGFKDLPPLPNLGIVLVQMILTGGFGLALIIGSVKLLRRRTDCLRWLQIWAFGRLVLAAIGLVAGILMMPTQMAYSKAMDQAIRDQLEARSPGASKNMPPYDEERQAATTRYGILATNLIVVAFPIFVAFLTTSRKKREEVASWEHIIR
jgi:hypothetical protein